MAHNGRRILLYLFAFVVIVVTACEFWLRMYVVPEHVPACNGPTRVTISGFHRGSVDAARGCHGTDRFTPDVEYEDGRLLIETPIEVAGQFADTERVQVRGRVGSHTDQEWWVRVLDTIAPLTHVSASDHSSNRFREIELPLPRTADSAITLDVGDPDPETSVVIEVR